MAQETPYADTPMSATYDQFSGLQLGGNLRNLPLLAEALAATDSHGGVLHLADFGSATGLNSMKTFSQAFPSFRETSDTQISVHHVDIPSNDWGILFNNAVNSPYSYLNIKGTFMEAIGRSHYGQVFPDNFLSIVYSTFSLNWLSRPVDSPNQLQRYLVNPNEIHQEASLIAEEDLDRFLSCRASELKVGGRMILHTPANTTYFMSIIYRALLNMSTEGLVSPHLLQNVKYSWYHRSEEDFQRAVSKLSTRLRILSITVYQDHNPYYKKYLENNDKEEYISSLKTMARAVSESVVRKYIELPDGPHPLLDELFKRFGHLVGEDIQPVMSKQLHVVIEKIA